VLAEQGFNQRASAGDEHAHMTVPFMLKKILHVEADIEEHVYIIGAELSYLEQ